MSNFTLRKLILTINNSHCFHNEYIKLNKESELLLDQLFLLLEKFKYKDEFITFYVSKEKDSKKILKTQIFNIYGKEVSNNVNWFEITIGRVILNENRVRRLIIINKKPVILVDSADENNIFYAYDYTDFLNWLIIETKNVINMVKNDTYYDNVNNNLPYTMRYGYITRKNYNKYIPNEINYFKKRIKQEDINYFLNIQFKENNYIQSLTCNEYYKICSLCYKALGYKTIGLNPQEQFNLYGNGFFNYLMSKINLNDSDEFENLIKEYRPNKDLYLLDYHIKFYPELTDNGYILVLDSNWYLHYQVDYIKIVNTLHKNNIPFVFFKYNALIEYIKQEGQIVINPYEYNRNLYYYRKIINYSKKHLDILNDITWDPIENLQIPAC